MRTRKDDIRNQIARVRIYARHPNYVVLTVNYFTLGAMSAAEPTSIKDVDGRTVRKGDVVRVLGIPDLSGMRDPYRGEAHAVFKHITGTRRKVYGFDQFGCAILVFGIRYGAHAGSHSVAIEPHLVRKVIGNKLTRHGT